MTDDTLPQRTVFKGTNTPSDSRAMAVYFLGAAAVALTAALSQRMRRRNPATRKTRDIGATSVGHGSADAEKIEPEVGSPSGRLEHLYPRPAVWHCGNCGVKCLTSPAQCERCQNPRPFLGGSITLMVCSSCKGGNLVTAKFCEWCGSRC